MIGEICREKLCKEAGKRSKEQGEKRLNTLSMAISR